LPRLIGWQKASAIMMLGTKVSAAEAERIGMIYQFFPDQTFAENSMNIAKYLAQMPTKGLAYTKLLLNNSLSTHFDEQLLDENIFQQRAAETEDYTEGVKAFIEKRKPVFRGL
jgi:2-(1,2-epoxy-1,2-dihydrophenyl)acetyl-CoA isomerase